MELANTKLVKIASVNIFILGVALISLDLLFGKYHSHSPALDIPESLVGHVKTIDTSSIENSKARRVVTYTRDDNGYRPYQRLPYNNKVILTLGGSTTDQRYIDDNKTWQRVLERKIGIPVLNGGVDGQSSFGHLFSIKNWHSKSLHDKQVDRIIFYLGVNDTRFSKGIAAAYGNIYDSPTMSRRIHGFLSRRSFLYGKLREAKLKLDTLRGVRSETPDGVIQVGHGITNPTFLNKSVESIVPLSTIEETQQYGRLFNDLLITSIKAFPNARIYVVQQHDPKCIIQDTKVLIRVSPKEIPTIMDYCSDLASIYRTQARVVNTLNNKSIALLKMFKDNPLPDHGFYDGIHTNSYGSRAIGEYLASNIK